MDDCSAALLLMSLSSSPKSSLFKDKLERLIRKESMNGQNKVPNRPTSSGSRIAMLPKQRYKQEARLMLLNADSIADTYQQRQAASKRTNNTESSKCNRSSTEEGFDEEFASFSEDDELLILQQTTTQPDDVQQHPVKPVLTTQLSTKSDSPKNKMKTNTILKPVTRMVFQCTWRTCGHECDVREQMEEHVRIKHLGITSCTDDHEEDFYYTEVELDSPLDSSGVSSAGQSPMHELSNNNSTLSTSILHFTPPPQLHHNVSSPTPVMKQVARKRGPKPKPKHLIESSTDHFTNSRLNSAIATWMHMDMAKPPHEDPEYLSKLNSTDTNTDTDKDATSNGANNQTTVIKRERKRAASNNASNQYASDQSDFELLSQQQYLQNLTAEQLIKLQQQNSLHLKNNIQHLQQLHRQHQQLHQLHQLHQYNQQVKRKYTKSQQSSGNSGSILMPTTRTKSVICSMAQLENELIDRHLLNGSSSLSPNPLKRSKPIKIPGISLAHRDYQPANQSSSFTVGSVQLSPTGYFHCFSPTPPHSLSSPTSSNSSMYSLGSCNSPGSSSIASSSSSYSPNGGQSSLNRNSAHYSPIDTLLQTVENERLQQQLAMEDESLQSAGSINSSRKLAPKLKSANVSDLDLVAQNEDEDMFDHHRHHQKTMDLKRIEDKNELVNQTLETIKCSNNSQLITNNSISSKHIQSSVGSVIRSGHDALLAESLTVNCDIDQQAKLKSNSNSTTTNNSGRLIDLQAKQQQLVQTAHQALVTLASTATNLCNSSSTRSQNTTSSIKSTATSQVIEKSNSIHNNSTNSNQTTQNNFGKHELNDKKHHHQDAVNQQNGLLMAANLIQSAAEQSQQQPPFNYLVSHSGRTIKPTPAAKSYVQRKHRITKYMRTQNSTPSNGQGKHGAIGKSKNNHNHNHHSNLIHFERLIEAAQSNNNNQNESSSTSGLTNMVRNSIISGVGSTNSASNHNNNQTTKETQPQVYSQPNVQRTPTGGIRNSGAKCRKKYGMENKHLWCVQCRWKKACSRVDSNSGLNLTQYNNQAGSTVERNRGRPGRPANSSNSSTSSSNNSDQRRAVTAQANSSSQTNVEQHRHQTSSTTTSNATGDFSAMAEELLRSDYGTLLNNQRTVVSAQ